VSAAIIKHVITEFMKRMSYFFVAIFCFAIFSSCGNFEKKLFSQLEVKQINAIKNGSDTFDLATIADFKWDSVMFITGDESVPEFKEFIEERLNGFISKISWEDRKFNKVIDPAMRLRAKDLPVGKDRFYFLTPDKRLIVRDISSEYHNQLSFIIKDKNTNTFNDVGWMSKDDCRFVLKNEGKELEKWYVIFNSISRSSIDSLQLMYCKNNGN
jgi:hypothetical protein